MIRDAAPGGYRPAEILQMIPRDWARVLRGHARVGAKRAPGGAAPSREEHDRLVARYGD